ncbi:uncharacterized protein LOC115226742 [Octopus sinensis]|uniref:Uncharacterized protein LOC115226742 n=1 Tax=Octopus sinensis TaxID=2607531 RepID=A0A6P7TWE6_9MOLL|nr:uncharacterized protein LOC115226742 [Octopus sinensis]
MGLDIGGNCWTHHILHDDDAIHKVEAAILEDHHRTLWQLNQKVKISLGSVVKTHLQPFVHVISTKDSQMLTSFQKQEWVNCSKALWQCVKKMRRIFSARPITQDEAWVHHYGPETKVQSKQWKYDNSSPPKKGRVQP